MLIPAPCTWGGFQIARSELNSAKQGELKKKGNCSTVRSFGAGVYRGVLRTE